MPTGEERLIEILKDENEAFVTESRELYVEVSKALKVAPKMETSLLTISRNTPTGKPLQSALDALKTEKVILLTARGNEVKKLVAIVEQIKQKGPGDIKQLNRLSGIPSLINPSYSAKHSISNIQIFLGDEVATKNEDAALKKEIKGHKMYDIPFLSVLLVRKSIDVPSAQFSDWTSQ